MTGTARDKIAFFACCFIKGDLPGAGGRGMDGSDVGLERCELAPSRYFSLSFAKTGSGQTQMKRTTL